MTEADIVFQYSEVVNRLWSLIQWWGGVSFGLIALAHLASEKLNGVLFLLVLSLYTAYSVLILSMLYLNGAMIGDFVGELNQLAATGETLGIYATRLSEGSVLSIPMVILGLVVVGGTYIACIFYPIYIYKHQR